MAARTALIVAAVALSCGGIPSYRERATALSKAGKIGAAIQALRYGLGEHPRDGAAHAALARLHDRAGRPGAALRHFLRAARYGALTQADRVRLAALHVERAVARLALGDGDAWRDLDAAKYRVNIDDALRARAYRAGALAELRELDPKGRSRANDLLRKLGAIDPRDPRLAILEPQAAELPALGRAAQWAWDGGANRVGLDLLVTYIERGGRAPRLVERWVKARLWWRGVDAELNAVVMDDWIRAGGDACLAAYTPSDYDCEALARPTLSLWTRAKRLHWRTTHSHLAGVFVSLALREWAVEGSQAGWLSLIVERVDVESLGAPATWPLFAAATLARERMDVEQADRWLERALGAIDDMQPHERAVVAAEVAIRGNPADLARVDQVPDYAWIAPAAAARAAGDRELERARLARAGPHVFRYLAGHGELATLVDTFGNGPGRLRYRSAHERQSAIMTPGAADVSALPFGKPDPVEVAWDSGLRDASSIEGLAAVARAYQRDPSLGFRTADDYVDERVATGARAPAVIELMIQLGEPGRALQRAEVLIAASPRHARYLQLAGVAATAGGDIERAEVHFIAAAARSGDAAAANLAAARAHARFGHDIAAIAAGRRALELTPPGEDHDVLLLLARTMVRLGRTDNAARVLKRYVERVPRQFRDAARFVASGIWGPGRKPAVLDGPSPATHRTRMLSALERGATLAEPVALQPTEALMAWHHAAELGGDSAASAATLARAAAWNSGHVRVRSQLQRIGELLSIALTREGEAREAALRALQSVATAVGNDDLAAAAATQAAIP